MNNKNHLGFFDFLIAPIQRIPRYSLLLGELLKNTDKSNLDYPNIETALTKINKQADFLNSNQKEFTYLSKVMKIDNRLRKKNSKWSLLDTPSRIYIMKSRITHFFNDTIKNRMLFLFNDLILIVKVKKSLISKEVFYSFKFKMNLTSNIQIIELNNDKRANFLCKLFDDNTNVENNDEKNSQLKQKRKRNKLNQKQLNSIILSTQTKNELDGLMGKIKQQIQTLSQKNDQNNNYDQKVKLGKESKFFSKKKN